MWALPRARRSINYRYNLVDLSRRSLTYESRLQKYAKRYAPHTSPLGRTGPPARSKGALLLMCVCVHAWFRGYAVAVPGLDRSRVDPFLFRKTLKSVHGLAKLLIMDRNAAKAQDVTLG